MRSTDVIFAPLLAIMSAVALGCNRDSNAPAQTDTKTQADEHAKTAGQAGQADQADQAGQAGQLTENGREFLLAAARDGQLEVEAGRLAEGKAQTEIVKEFARMMVEHHTRANDELASLARSVNVEVPRALDENGRDKLDELRGETGREFDEEYMDLMVDEHWRVIQQFEREAERDANPSVRSWATQMLPTLRSHLEMAKKIEDSVDEVPLPGGAGSQPGGAGAQPEAGSAGSQPGAGDTRSGDTKSGDTKTRPDASPTPGGR